MNDVLVLNSDMAPVSLLPISTLNWQKAIKAVFLGSVVVVAEYEAWEVHSPSMTLRVPSVVMNTNYIHFSKQIGFSKDLVFLRDLHTCQYCYKGFNQNDLTVDHVLPISHGGATSWDNLVTSCAPCNSRKGDNKKIVPKVRPRKPNYYELLEKRKSYRICVPCPSWVDFLNWPTENIEIAEKKILRTGMNT